MQIQSSIDINAFWILTSVFRLTYIRCHVNNYFGEFGRRGQLGILSKTEFYKKRHTLYIVNAYNLKTVKDIDMGVSDAYIECY